MLVDGLPTEEDMDGSSNNTFLSKDLTRDGKEWRNIIPFSKNK